MKRYLPVFLLALGCGLALTSCSQILQQQNKPDTEEETTPEIPPPLYLGSVHQVFPDDKFALLRIIGPMPTEGTVLITHPTDGSTERIGNLIVSSAQHARNNIIAADIRAGVVIKGDRVFKYRSIASAPIEEEEPEPFTMSGTEIDVGYTPPEIKDNIQESQVSTEETPVEEPAPEQAETGILPAAAPPVPAIPAPPASGKFDDIPDNISDWDSM